MNSEPRCRVDYGARQIEAARRVLLDLAQVLGAFQDCVVVVGGWVPDLLVPDADEPHVGSIDVDLALDTAKLDDGRYADLIKLLLGTRRYAMGDKHFRLVATIDLGDGEPAVEVEIDFLAPRGSHIEKHRPKLVEGFRVLLADGCASAFNAPQEVVLAGRMMSGAANKVTFHVASVPDFLVMKAHALTGRDKPKDAYDICYCLDHFPGGLEALAVEWRGRRDEADVKKATEILREKFCEVDHFGPMHVVEFLGSTDEAERAVEARRAFELVQAFLRLL